MDRYLVVGNPVSHSLSPRIHAAFAEQTGERLVYEKALVPIGGFAEFVDEFVAEGGRGLNVTVPFKLDAFAYVDEHDAMAERAQAVNTVSVIDKQTHGFNTDGIGLCRDLTERLDLDLAGMCILILGAGGAARGILQPLLQAGPEAIVIANRTVAKAESLVEEFMSFRGDTDLVAVGLTDVGAPADLILNSTSSGLGGETIELPRATIEDALCYDLAYGEAARFSAWAAANGARGVSDGLGMLVEQAAESFAIWRGVRPLTDSVYAGLRSSVDQAKPDG